LFKWNGDHIGSNMISTGSTGVARQVALARAAARADRLARPHHVGRVDGIADHLQSEVRLDARADVEVAFMDQRPAAVGSLDPPQVVCDLGLERGIYGLGEIVPEQHILRRDGAVGLEFEDPMAVGLPETEQRLGRRVNARLEHA
jgi:hypothetical protein